MSNLGLNVADIVNVQVVMSPIAASTRNFGSLMILGDSSVVDVNERMRLYTDLATIATDFGTTAPEYLAAAIFFSQSPTPSTLYVGRWASAATAGLMYGGALSTAEQAIANFTSITTGAFKIAFDGAAESALSGIDLHLVTTLNGVASAITAKLSGSQTCTWDSVNKRFVFTSGTTGATSAVAFASAPASGTDIRTLLKITAATGASVVGGIAVETLANCVALHANNSNNWYGLYVAATASVANADYEAVAALIEGLSTSRIFGITTQDANTLLSTSTTDLAYLLSQLKYKRTFIQYCSSNKYASAGIFGRAFTVNFLGSNTTITIKFKTEPGIAAEYLTETQAASLSAKKCNVYVNFNNNTAILQEGVMTNGYFFDEVHGTDWLQNAVQTEVYNLLYTSPTKIPQTDAGVNILVAGICQECEQAVTNGLLAPGVWQQAGFGALNQNDTLAKGYYVYAPPVASQDLSARASRRAPVIQVAAKLAGAIHFSDIIINVNR